METKSFEIVKNAIELSLIERSRNHFSIVMMGFVAALWLCDVLLEVAKLLMTKIYFGPFARATRFLCSKNRGMTKGGL